MVELQLDPRYSDRNVCHYTIYPYFVSLIRKKLSECECMNLYQALVMTVNSHICPETRRLCQSQFSLLFTVWLGFTWRISLFVAFLSLWLQPPIGWEEQPLPCPFSFPLRERLAFLHRIWCLLSGHHSHGHISVPPLSWWPLKPRITVNKPCDIKRQHSKWIVNS